ncbi:Rab GDP dissociation inhibitor alpha [Irineochytrium annulatum]|nr:Rab GDP dissociation inhibitor alpha [Irineochytrium annulatum]
MLVLHMDRNDYYGGASASLNLTQLYRKFRSGSEPPATYGRDRDFNVDLIPKFAMASGEFVNILYHTDVTRYLEFRQVAGSYVFRDDHISKVPASQQEALTSSLMNLMEKTRAKSFFEFIQSYDFKDPGTQKGLDLDKVTMADVYKKFGLEPGTQDFIGHSLALWLDDEYMQKPARETYERICLYMNSMARYGKSPYIYPLYGLGELPQGFARLSAIYGGTYMLSKPVDEIVYEGGKAVGVKSEGEVAKAKCIIGDPTYFPDKVKKVGQVVRAICLLNHPIPNTADADSLQIIIPQNQIGRKQDIYIAAISGAHSVCSKDHYIAIVSTIVETSDPSAEIEPGLKLLGSIQEKFISVEDLYDPLGDGKSDGVFISKSYDATSHFETVCRDVKDIYRRITGNELKVEGKVKKVEEDPTDMPGGKGHRPATGKNSQRGGRGGHHGGPGNNNNNGGKSRRGTSNQQNAAKEHIRSMQHTQHSPYSPPKDVVPTLPPTLHKIRRMGQAHMAHEDLVPPWWTRHLAKLAANKVAALIKKAQYGTGLPLVDQEAPGYAVARELSGLCLTVHLNLEMEGLLAWESSLGSKCKGMDAERAAAKSQMTTPAANVDANGVELPALALPKVPDVPALAVAAVRHALEATPTANKSTPVRSVRISSLLPIAGECLRLDVVLAGTPTGAAESSVLFRVATHRAVTAACVEGGVRVDGDGVVRLRWKCEGVGAVDVVVGTAWEERRRGTDAGIEMARALIRQGMEEGSSAAIAVVMGISKVVRILIEGRGLGIGSSSAAIENPNDVPESGMDGYAVVLMVVSYLRVYDFMYGDLSGDAELAGEDRPFLPLPQQTASSAFFLNFLHFYGKCMDATRFGLNPWASDPRQILFLVDDIRPSLFGQNANLRADSLIMIEPHKAGGKMYPMRLPRFTSLRAVLGEVFDAFCEGAALLGDGGSLLGRVIRVDHLLEATAGGEEEDHGTEQVTSAEGSVDVKIEVEDVMDAAPSAIPRPSGTTPPEAPVKPEKEEGEEEEEEEGALKEEDEGEIDSQADYSLRDRQADFALTPPAPTSVAPSEGLSARQMRKHAKRLAKERKQQLHQQHQHAQQRERQKQAASKGGNGHFNGGNNGGSANGNGQNPQWNAGRGGGGRGEGPHVGGGNNGAPLGVWGGRVGKLPHQNPPAHHPPPHLQHAGGPGRGRPGPPSMMGGLPPGMPPGMMPPPGIMGGPMMRPPPGFYPFGMAEGGYPGFGGYH